MKPLTISQRAMLVKPKSSIPTEPDASTQSSEVKPDSLLESSYPAGPAKTSSGPSTMMHFMEKDSKANSENKRLLEQNNLLRDELEVWSESILTKKISPELIVPSKYANRHTDTFEDQEFIDLVEEIKNSEGNVQPIKVRPIPATDPQKYEIVFGHRRHKACSIANVDVLAMVDSITDQALFEQMDRENRQRSNLRPWEQGEMYRKALEDGLYSGVSQMAEALGQSKGNVSVALKIANFPKEILAAFPSPVSIQFRWATPLGKFIEENSQLAIFRAKEITGERQSGVAIDANLTFSRLVEPIKAKPLAPRKEVEIGEVTLICSAKKDGTASISLSKIPADKADAVEKAIIKALS